MFSLLSGFMNILLEKPLYKLLIIGEEKVGKTVSKTTHIINLNISNIFIIQTFLEQLKYTYTGRCTPLDLILPTSGLNCK